MQAVLFGDERALLVVASSCEVQVASRSRMPGGGELAGASLTAPWHVIPCDGADDPRRNWRLYP